jgi:hypothetical protein
MELFDSFSMTGAFADIMTGWSAMLGFCIIGVVVALIGRMILHHGGGSDGD